LTPKELPNHWIALTTASLILLRQFGLGLDLTSLLMLVPWIVCCVPALDSIQGQGRIRTWNKWRIRFDITERDEKPFSYWLILIISWPASFFFAYALVMMPKQ
jgi:hypothetical protein